MNCEIKREHTGKMHLFVGGVPANGALITSIDYSTDGKAYARVSIPLDRLSFSELENVVPFVRPPLERETR